MGRKSINSKFKKGHSKRTTSTQRAKKFKREIKQLGTSMARGKRFRGAGRSGKDNAASSRKKQKLMRKVAPLEEIIGEVHSSSSAAVCDSLDARSILDMMMTKNKPTKENTNKIIAQKEAPPTSAAAASSSSASSSSNPQRKTIQESFAATSTKTNINDLDASKLDAIRSTTRVVPDAEEEVQKREAAEAAAAAAAASTSSLAKNRNLYARHGEDHQFWKDQGIAPQLREALVEMNFTHPTPVQEYVFPRVLPQLVASSSAQKQKQQKKKPQEEAGAEPDDDGDKDKDDDDDDDDEEEATAVDQQPANTKSERNRKRDFLVSSETGSGKTLLFALTTIQHLLLTSPSLDFSEASTTGDGTKEQKQQQKKQRYQQKRRQRDDEDLAEKFMEWDKIRCLHTLVLTPTRELAEQIHRVYASLTKKCDRRIASVGCILGGMAFQKQQRIVNRRPHVLICTPGRVWDLVGKNEGCYLGHSISRRLSFLVLDEADRLLQTGHYQDLHFLLDRIHCEVLPSGLLVGGGLADAAPGARVVGADGSYLPEEKVDETLEDGALVSGTWDPVKKRFIPHHHKQEEKQKKKQQQQKKKSSSSHNDDDELEVDDDDDDEQGGHDDDEEFADEEDDEMELDEEDHDEEGAEQDEEGEDEEGPADEQDEEDDEQEQQQDEDEEDAHNNQHHQHPAAAAAAASTGFGQSKDIIRQMPTPPPPPWSHRPVTIVTSATLTLQANFSHRNVKTKHYTQTSNVNTLGRVLSDLGIKERRCQIFNMADILQEHQQQRRPTGVVQTLHEAYTRCTEGSKDLNLIYFLRCCSRSDERTIIFVNAISMLRRLFALLTILGFRVSRLHSSMPQRSRLSFTEKFRSGEQNVLIATDIASRGLDVDDIRYVVHYQMPRTTDAYIHRCGRTARCGSTGFSLMLVAPNEFTIFKQLLKSMNRHISSMEVFSPESSSRQMKDLYEALKVCLQIDKLEREITKSTTNQRWVKNQMDGSGVDASDMVNPDLAQENREKAKVAKILRKRLAAMMRDIAGKGVGGRGSFLATPRTLGTAEAVQNIRDRTKRQMYIDSNVE